MSQVSIAHMVLLAMWDGLLPGRDFGSLGRGSAAMLPGANTFLFMVPMASFSVLSWNARGLNSAVKRSLVFNYLKKFTPQIFVLQETRLVGSRVFVLKKAWVGWHYHAAYSSYSRGGEHTCPQIPLVSTTKCQDRHHTACYYCKC